METEMETETETEVESKYDVSPDFVMPTFVRSNPELHPGTSSHPGSHPAEVASVDVDRVAIASTYFDTEDGRLLRFMITLRHRDGQADTGWQLKVPSGEDRVELHWPSDPAPYVAADVILPAGLAALLAPFLRGAAVVPSVRLDVSRTRYRLSNASASLIAEVCDDEVRAFPLRAPVRAPRWREVEIELGEAGRRRMLIAIGDRLLAAGAYPSTSHSKLARARVGVGNEGIGSPRSSAGAVLMHYMTEQARVIFGGHFAVVAGQPDSIHQTRVATRRLRSTLRTFHECFVAEKAMHFEAELKWFAALLGQVRDREVLIGRLSSAVDDLPADLVVGPVAEKIKTRLSEELSQAQEEVQAGMAGQRYALFLSEVLRWRDDPPFTAASGRPAKTLREPVRKAHRKLTKRLASASGSHSTADDLHSARKTGKRVRYAAEAADDDDDDLISWSSGVQDLLGEFHDSVVAVDVLRRLAVSAADQAEDTFTYGVLVALQRESAERDRQQLRDR